jgi:hypothetical protein
MPRKKKMGYTTIGIPIYVRDKLKKYGEFGESWTVLFERLMQEVDDAKRIKEKYRLK